MTPGIPENYLGFSRQEHWSGLPFPPPMRESEVAQLCPTLRDPMDCSLPGSSVHGIFQARVRIWYPPVGRWIPWFLRWYMRSRSKWKYFLPWVSYSLGDARFSSWKCTPESRRSICLSQDPQGSAWSHGQQASTFLLPAYRTSQIFSASGPWLILVSDVVEKQNMCYMHI